jgi:hypothetical protein
MSEHPDTSDRPITQEDMHRLACLTDEFLPPGHGFIVFAFPLGDAPDRRMRYVSNCKREDSVNALKEWLAQKHQE